MAITGIAKSAEVFGSATSHTLTEPAGSQAGDALVAVFGLCVGTSAASAPAGWTTIANIGATATLPGLLVAGIVRGASAPDLTFTRAAAEQWGGTLMRYRSDGTITGFGTATTFASDNTLQIAHTLTGGVTTSVDNQLVLMASSVRSNPQHLASVNATDPGTASNGVEDVVTLPQTGAWTTRMDVVKSVSVDFGYMLDDAVRATAGSTGDIVSTYDANTRATMAAFTLIESGGGTGLTITLDELTQNRVIAGHGGTADVPFSGTHNGADGVIEGQIERVSDGAIIVPWTALGTSSSGAFSGALTCPRVDDPPAARWLIRRVRLQANTAVTDVSANQFGVGFYFGLHGQSHAQDLSTNGTGTPSAFGTLFNGTTYTLMTSTGAGINALVNDVVTYTSGPVAYADDSVSGANISRWWASGAATVDGIAFMDECVAGGEMSAMIFWQGDANTQTGQTSAQYEAEMDGWFGYIRSRTRADLPIIVVALGRNQTGNTDAAWEAIRDAHKRMDSKANTYVIDSYDVEQGVDNHHFSDAGLAVLGSRLARALGFAHSYAATPYYKGPAVGSATIAGSVVSVNLTHNGGSTVTPTTGITGFDVLDNGTPVTINSAVRATTNRIDLTLAATPSGTVTLRYAYGMYPDVAGVVLDSNSLPLQTTDSDVSVGTSAIGTLTLDPVVTGAGDDAPAQTINLTVLTATWPRSVVLNPSVSYAGGGATLVIQDSSIQAGTAYVVVPEGTSETNALGVVRKVAT